MQDLTQALSALEDVLYKITRKEAVISRQMRMMADHTDQLIGDIDRLRDILANFPVDDLQKPEAISSETSLSEPSATVKKPLVSGYQLPEAKMPDLAPAAPVIEPRQEAISPDSPVEEPVQAVFVDELASASGPIYSDTKQDLKPTPFNSPFLNQKESKDIDRFELDLGIKWLSRIGIVALLIGIAMALSYSFPNFTKEMKLFTGLIVASGLFFGGGKLYLSSPILGRILQGGGLSVGYLSVFAMFFIPEVQVFNAAGVGIFCLFLYVGLVLGLAHKMNSQTVALLSLAFGYYTAGYSESHLIAFWSTAVLSLGTAAVARLHQDWTILPKANLLGALVTYAIWYQRDSLRDDVSARIYLIYTFGLFHIVSLLRGKAGDVLLNQVNSFSFYCIYSMTQTAIGSNGLLEFLIAGVQWGSLLIVNAIRPENRQGAFSLGLVLLTLLFLGFGTMKYFDGMTLSAILAAEALCMSFLSMKSEYRRMLASAAYLFFLIGYGQMLLTWHTLSDQEILLNGLWVTISGFIMEAIPFRAHEKFVRGTLLSGCALLLLSATIDAVPSEWRTISIAISGFMMLTSGFLCKRKLYRWLGLGWIFVPGGISILSDMIHLTMGYKILLFILLGIGLLGGSYGYSLLERRLSRE